VEAAGVGEPSSVTAVTKETGEYYFSYLSQVFKCYAGCTARKLQNYALSQG
jgi:hypothetical protein